MQRFTIYNLLFLARVFVVIEAFDLASRYLKPQMRDLQALYMGCHTRLVPRNLVHHLHNTFRFQGSLFFERPVFELAKMQ